MSLSDTTARGLVHAAMSTTPLDPTREQARAWARRELSDPAYARAEPGWVERLARWVFGRLSDLQVPAALSPGKVLGVVVLLALAALAAALVVNRTGRLRVGAHQRRRATTVLDDARLPSQQHRRLADEAAAHGRWDDAVRERFRAITRSLEERTILDERPGRTAVEVADEAGQTLPATAAELRAAARMFDDVWYGGRPATAAHDAQLQRLDDEVIRARPAFQPVAASPPR